MKADMSEAGAPPPATATTDVPNHHHEAGTDLMLTAPTDDHQSRPLRYTVVKATPYPPSGRRERWYLAVEDCPFCEAGGPHIHAFSDIGLGGGARRAGCGKGIYWLAVASGENGHA